MKIKKKIEIATGVTVFLLSFMVLFLMWVYFERQKIQMNLDLTHDMKKTCNDILLLREEYLLHHEDRPMIQWNSKVQELNRLAFQAGEMFTGESDIYHVNNLKKELEINSRIFTKFSAHLQGAGIMAGEDRLFTDGDKRLISQIIVHAYRLNNTINSLHDSAEKKSDSARNKTTVIIFSIMALAILITAGNSVSIGWSITGGISALMKGSKFIGSGDLDHRIEVRGDDEFSVLARAVNEMAEKLKSSYTSADNLEKEISSRREAEELMRASLKDKEALIKELQHRTKNNMQVISSLLSIQERFHGGIVSKDIFADVQGRIGAMALVHDLMVKTSNLSSIDLKQYLRELIDVLVSDPRAGGKNIHIDFDVESCPVSLDSAVPCGLVINELFGNSLKHAFPENREGRITIKLHMNERREINLAVIDNGIGMPPDYDHEKAKTMGLSLAWKLVANQLQGKMERRGSSGTEFHISFTDNPVKRV